MNAESASPLSRRSVYWAAWALFVASIFIPAPAGSFAGGATGISGFYVLGRAIVWSEAPPGSSQGLEIWRSAILTFAFFANIVFFFTLVLRNHRTVSVACKVFLAGAVVIAGCVAFAVPEFVRLPAYWVWLSSLAVLAWAFVGFAGSGAVSKAAPKRAAAGESVPDEGDVPQLVWVWLSFAVFWLAVSVVDRAHPAAAAPAGTQTDPPSAAALPSYFNDNANVVPADTAAQLNNALANFEKETSNQIAVAIYPRAPLGAIDTFTIETADRSRLGRKGLDNGAILFVFMAERAARLEVGYGLEGVLTDVDARRILDTHLVPAFARGDYSEGLDTALGAIFVMVEDAYKRDRMPGKAAVFWRQLKVEVPKLLNQAWPAVSGVPLEGRLGIAFFGSLLGLGIWDGLRQFGRLLRNLAHGAGNLAARRPFNSGMESVGLDSVIDTVKVVGIALAFIAGAAGLVVVAAGGAFGGAGTLVHW